ncbi:AAA domain-containing protein [Methylobacillus arboreus]|uniref:AAA domain-containing protein n=1 Tax=Methylobacillus arboreus TaxID=755170 RepID=UPI001E4B5753|nr:AAA domain-containing protein [Methylobacillus arboreus]MCB5189465.1 AAA domain-containing protein [Methylobacillus arboreus]
MVSIFVDGDDKTTKITDWTLRYDAAKDILLLTCHFRSGKTYTRPITACEITPTEEIQGRLLQRPGGIIFNSVEKVTVYGGKYAAVYYPGNSRPYLMKADELEFIPQTTIKEGTIFNYFVSVAQARIDQTTGDNKSIAENVLRQLEKVVPHPDTALHAYCTGKNQSREQIRHFIYPFGINASQLQAVEQAFSSQISLIEGPPGTGKTQTILNIIANILLQQKTVAILSNNNAAVDNVYEKLQKSGLDYLIAKLGSTDNRKAFFENPPEAPSEAPPPAPDIQDIDATLQKLKQYLDARNQVAQLKAEIDELRIEQQYLQRWQDENLSQEAAPIERYELSPQQITDLIAYLSHLGERPINLWHRMTLLLNFRIVRTKFMNNWEKRKSLIDSLQRHYYEKALQQKSAVSAALEKILEYNHADALLHELTSTSMTYLKHHLYQRIPREEKFNEDDYKKRFSTFTKRFPIIGSSTHSIINSIANDAILDYVIIDEASQQDIVPGILGLGCARNLIIVGDSKQLPHVPVNLDIALPAEFYDCVRYSLLDSCIGVFNHALPATLLKEHYRCHPKIIQFCNKQFYDNQLIPMTQDNGEQALSLVITAKGNHEHRLSNLRELESLGPLSWDAEQSRGFIAPYNAQVNQAKRQLPSDFVNSTVHKFQGRECDEIIFSTVLDKKRSSQQKVGFVDNPHLVNVAVSRAKHNFTLVTGDNVFSEKNRCIAALIRYIEYYADKEQIRRSPVVSAFDLLYQEYDQSLEKLNTKLNLNDSAFKSEQIIARLLRDTFSQDAYRAITFHSQVALIQLVSLTNNSFTSREQEFMRNRASCDFVLYFKVGKTPLGVIEVDGKTHDSGQQAERDQLKNSILEKSSLPLLRLKTIESSIEEKISTFLAQWGNNSQTISNQPTEESVIPVNLAR